VDINVSKISRIIEKKKKKKNPENKRLKKRGGFAMWNLPDNDYERAASSCSHAVDLASC